MSESTVSGDRIRKVEEAVLSTYKVHNPSYNPKQRANVGRQIARMSAILEEAGLPTDLRGKSVLDVACGTGEYTIGYSALGAKVTGVDINEEAVALATQLYQENGYSAEFVVSSLFDLHFPETSFDVVSSIGTLHHTADPEKAFHLLARLVKPNGYFILCIADAYGCWLRRLRRWVVIALSGKNVARRVSWSEILWWNFLRRTEKYGGRPRKAVVYDWFVNPQHSFHTPAQVLGWFKDAGLEVVGCYPTRANLTEHIGRVILAVYCITRQRHHSQVWYVGKKVK